MSDKKNSYYTGDLSLRRVKIQFCSLFQKTTHPSYPDTTPKFYVSVYLDKSNDEHVKAVKALNNEIESLFKNAFEGKIPKYKNSVIIDGDDEDIPEKQAKYSKGKWIVKSKSSAEFLDLTYKGDGTRKVKESENLFVPGATIDLFFKVMIFNAQTASRGVTALLIGADFKKQSDLFQQSDITHLLERTEEDEEEENTISPEEFF
jgi:hypothetical protein